MWEGDELHIWIVRQSKAEPPSPIKFGVYGRCPIGRWDRVNNFSTGAGRPSDCGNRLILFDKRLDICVPISVLTGQSSPIGATLNRYQAKFVRR
jgi:hypothetical protein